MLIAMMAKTFDNVWDMQALNHQFMFAQNVATWHDAEPCPPPASGLRLVSQIVVFLYGFCAEKTGGLTKGRLSSSASKRNAALHAIPDYSGTEVNGRNSWKVWRNYHPPTELAGAIDAYLQAHEDDVAQEDRWRVKLMKRMAMQYNTLKRGLGELEKVQHDMMVGLAKHGMVEEEKTPASKWREKKALLLLGAKAHREAAKPASGPPRDMHALHQQHKSMSQMKASSPEELEQAEAAAKEHLKGIRAMRRSILETEDDEDRASRKDRPPREFFRPPSAAIGATATASGSPSGSNSSNEDGQRKTHMADLAHKVTRLAEVSRKLKEMEGRLDA